MARSLAHVDGAPSDAAGSYETKTLTRTTWATTTTQPDRGLTPLPRGGTQVPLSWHHAQWQVELFRWRSLTRLSRLALRAV